MTTKLEALHFGRAKGSRREPLSVSFRCIRPNAYDGPAREEEATDASDAAAPMWKILHGGTVDATSARIVDAA